MKKDNSELFKWDGKPSFGQVLPLAAQHVLAAVVGCVTPAILVANAANNAGGNVDMGLLIQVSLVFAALSTLLQLYAQKIKLGSGLPVIIGVSFAYVPTCYRYGYSGNRSFPLQHSCKLYGRKLFQYL